MLSYATWVTEQRPADETAAQALKYYLSYKALKSNPEPQK